jgi:hypothetical protein
MRRARGSKMAKMSQQQLGLKKSFGNTLGVMKVVGFERNCKLRKFVWGGSESVV